MKFNIGIGPKRYVFTFKSEERPTPLSRSFEDDMVTIAQRHGGCFGRLNSAGFRAYERSRFLHSFVLYRLYRAALRPFVAAPDDPFTFGEVGEQGRRISFNQVMPAGHF